MDYDEFGLLADNATECGLTWAGPPPVRREFGALPPEEAQPGQQVSVLVWGEADPEVVLPHGGALNVSAGSYMRY